MSSTRWLLATIGLLMFHTTLVVVTIASPGPEGVWWRQGVCEEEGS